MIYSYKSKWSKIGKMILFYTLFAISLYCNIKSHQMGYRILKCGIFCFFHDGNMAHPDIVVNSGQQFLGMLYFFTSLLFTFVIFGQLVLLHIQTPCNKSFFDDNDSERPSVLSLPLQINSFYGNENVDENIETSALHSLQQSSSTSSLSSSVYNKKSPLYIILMVAVFLILYPILIFACCSLPTWWNGFSPPVIQNYRATDPKNELNNGNYLKIGSFFSWNLGSEQYPQYIFLFPDIIMYYTMIYFVVCVTLLSEIYSPLRSLLLKKITTAICVGELLIATLLICFLVSLFIYFYFDHGWQNGTLAYPTVNNTESAARCMGQLANAVTGLLILPVSRNSIWSLVFGIPGEAMIAYHKLMGYIWFVVVFAHMFLWWANFKQNNLKFPQAILSIPSEFHNDNFTIPLSILTFFITIVLMGIMSNYWIRKYYHELFYWSHHFSLILFFVMLWHATMSWYFITAGLILYAVDHMIRFSRCVGINVNVEYANVVDNGDSSVVFLSYKASMPSLFSLSTKPKQFSYEMGQYVFVNIPDISIAEWHPFTISSAPNDSIISHHIKSHDNNQWTGKLRDYINSLDRVVSTNPFKNITINIDGPYGIPMDVSKYTSILFIAGGIGITPMHSCLRQIYTSIKANSNIYPKLRKVRLIWISKINEKIFDYTWNMVLSDNINAEASTNKLFSCAKYLTKKTNSSGVNSPLGGSNNSNPSSVKSLVSSMASSTSSTNSSYNFYEYCEVYNCRPNLEKEIFDIHLSEGLSCVYCCGPVSLMQACEEISMRFTNMEFKKEYFEL